MMNHLTYQMYSFIKTRKPLDLAVLPLYLCFVSGKRKIRRSSDSKSYLYTITQEYYISCTYDFRHFYIV